MVEVPRREVQSAMCVLRQEDGYMVLCLSQYVLLMQGAEEMSS